MTAWRRLRVFGQSGTHGGLLAAVYAVALAWFGITLGWYFLQEPERYNPAYMPLWAVFVAWPVFGFVATWFTLGAAAGVPALLGYGIWLALADLPEEKAQAAAGRDTRREERHGREGTDRRWTRTCSRAGRSSC